MRVQKNTNQYIVIEVELVHATPSYARIRFSSGQEATVTLRDVARLGHKSAFNRNSSETDDEFEHVFLFNCSDASDTVNCSAMKLTLPETEFNTKYNDICDNSPVIGDHCFTSNLRCNLLVSGAPFKRFAYSSNYTK